MYAACRKTSAALNDLGVHCVLEGASVLLQCYEHAHWKSQDINACAMSIVCFVSV